MKKLKLDQKPFANIALVNWFDNALKASEFDVLVKFLDNPADQTSWMWDENSCQFVRRFEDQQALPLSLSSEVFYVFEKNLC